MKKVHHHFLQEGFQDNSFPDGYAGLFEPLSFLFYGSTYLHNLLLDRSFGLLTKKGGNAREGAIVVTIFWLKKAGDLWGFLTFFGIEKSMVFI
jgi:hypothetical protein